AVRADDARLVAEDGAHLVDVERLALRQVLDDVDEDDVRVVARGERLRARGTDVPRADDGDLRPSPRRLEVVETALQICHHALAPSLSMIASATSLVPTAVGSSRVGFMSYVRLFPSRTTSAMASSRRAAASFSSRWRSISIPERSCAIGFTLFWPA